MDFKNENFKMSWTLYISIFISTTSQGFATQVCSEVNTQLCIQRAISTDLLHFANYPNPDVCKTLRNETAHKLIEDGHKCIATFLGGCDQKDRSPNEYRRYLEMLVHTVEQTCGLEFESNCLGDVTQCINSNFQSNLPRGYRQQFENVNFSSPSSHESFCRTIVKPFETNYIDAFKCMCKLPSSCQIDLTGSPGYKISWASLYAATHYVKTTACHPGCTNLSTRLADLAMCTNKAELFDAIGRSRDDMRANNGQFDFEDYCRASSAAVNCILEKVEGCPYLIQFVRTLLEYLPDNVLYQTLAELLDECPDSSYNDFEVTIHMKHQHLVQESATLPDDCKSEVIVSKQVHTSSSGMSKMTLAGIIVGVIVGLALIAIIVWIVVKGPPMAIRKLFMRAKDDSTVQFENKGFEHPSTAEV